MTTRPPSLALPTAPICDQGQSVSVKRAVFTNCGNADSHKSQQKQVQSRLQRVVFTVSRLMEFCNRRELVNQTGHGVWEWPLVVLKELVDNALDACEEAGVAPAINIVVDGDRIIIADNGLGIPATTIESVLDYSVRVSSREAYVAPTRGSQGNALKTILPMGYVLEQRQGDNACGVTLIEARGIAHHIRFSVDHVRQEPRIEHTTRPPTVTGGTRITVQLAVLRPVDEPYRRERFLALAESYVFLNPHLSLSVIYNGKQEIEIAASDPTWAKWLPSWPTSPHWYDKSAMRRYMAAHIANRENITVREFIGEFAGMSGTARRKTVLAEIGASHVSLYDYFGRQRANAENIAKLLAALKKHTKPVTPRRLGVIGKEHLFRMMEAGGSDPKTFTYQPRFGEDDNGLPRVIEFAFGIHRDGLKKDAAMTHGKIITGVNWSPGINNPFRQIGRDGESLDAVLERARASTSQPVIAVLHLACPRVQYTDRGKSAIVIDGENYDGQE
jgi:hypothetical protein